MGKKSFLLFSIIISLFLTSCNKTDNKHKEIIETSDIAKVLSDRVLSKEQRDTLTIKYIINSLKEGNNRFVNNDLTARNHSEQIRQATKGQYPKAFVLSCVDSRVPVEDIFDMGIGDLFVGRVAGNFINEDLLGSMEFGCKVSGAKVILVLGHEDCGAIKSAIDDVKLGNITKMLSNIRPAIKYVKYDGPNKSTDREYVHEVCESNVINTIKEIKKRSLILKEMENNGDLKIIGGIYNMETGKVNFISL